LKPQFRIPGAPVFEGMPVRRAEMVCNAITEKDLQRNCVFDVATTGDPIFAEGYRLMQELRLYGTRVQLKAAEAPLRQDRMPVEDNAELPKPPLGATVVTASVLPLNEDRPTPTGAITFFVDGMPTNRPTPLDERGRAHINLRLAVGEHVIRAVYAGGGKFEHHSSSSANLIYAVREGKKKPTRPSKPKNPVRPKDPPKPTR
jgi:hypothetical protein